MLPVIPPGKEWRGRLNMNPGHAGFVYSSGTAFYSAQLDFQSAGVWKRLYVSCLVPEAATDTSYPRDGFYLLGPDTDDQQSAENLAAVVAGQKTKQRLSGIPGGGLEWHKIGKDKTSVLDPEIIYTRGQALCDHPEYYLLFTRLVSDRNQKLNYRAEDEQIIAVFLNGKRLSDKEIALKKGGNELLLVSFSGTGPSPKYGSGNFSPKNYGAFFRLEEPNSGRRAISIRYCPARVGFGGE
jgi:hypothetical protein